MLNTTAKRGTVDATRAILMIGGTQVQFTEWSATHSGVMDAGQFEAKAAAPFSDWAWWSQQTEILVDVFVGTPKDPQNYTTDDLTMIMTARCDSIEIDAGRFEVRLSGRDMSSLLIDNKTTDKWPNLTSSEIAQQIASQWGFESQITATKTPVGRFYAADHVVLAKADTYWNILNYLAQREGFQCFVLGKTLYFGKYGAVSSNEPYVINFDSSANVPVANASALRFERDLTLAQDLSVTVRSYHGFYGESFKATATSTKTIKSVEKFARLAQIRQKYDFTIPGLTQPECALKAQSILQELSRHELKVEAELPMDSILFPWVNLQVEGTGTPWDALYMPMRVTRRMSMDRMRMEVNAKTGIPQQTVTLS